MAKTILITGAGGQIGENLIARYKELNNVTIIASDINKTAYEDVINLSLNVLDKTAIEVAIKDFNVTEIIHLAAILSASGEKSPMKAWDINMKGLIHILELAKEYQCKVFWPSSIAVFGSTTPKENTLQTTITEPDTVYGISKVAGELWCQYYFKHYKVDVRSIRFPGLISWQGEPGGGTTDYAVEIFHKAILDGYYQCFLTENSYLPMLFMDDAIDAILQIMDAPSESISIRTAYNLMGMSFSPKEIAAEIRKHNPTFKIEYKPDFRQIIADTWPSSLDDSFARKDWGWTPKYNLQSMTTEMIRQLKRKLVNP